MEWLNYMESIPRHVRRWVVGTLATLCIAMLGSISVAAGDISLLVIPYWPPAFGSAYNSAEYLTLSIPSSQIKPANRRPPSTEIIPVSAPRGRERMSGWRFESIPEGSIYHVIGLRGGDILVGVDTKPCFDLADTAPPGSGISSLGAPFPDRSGLAKDLETFQRKTARHAPKEETFGLPDMDKVRVFEMFLKRGDRFVRLKINIVE